MERGQRGVDVREGTGGSQAGVPFVPLPLNPALSPLGDDLHEDFN